jgi:hypothetical protein
VNQLERNFFQKNVYTLVGCIVFALIVTVVFTLFYKQNQTKESLNKITKENSQLKQENEELKNEQSLNKDKFTSEINTLKFQNNGISKENQNYKKMFEQLQVDLKNELGNSFGVFSPEYSKKGDKVAGHTVTDVYSKENSNGSKNYKIDFSGEFVAKGTIIANLIGGGFTVTIENNLEKLPHTLQEFERVNFTIKNDDDLRKALAENNISFTSFYNLEIEAVFKNYTYNYVPETNVQNAAEFVRLNSQKLVPM